MLFGAPSDFPVAGAVFGNNTNLEELGEVCRECVCE